MSGYSKEQICPYCDNEADFKNFDQDSDGIITCYWCNNDYFAMPQYKFLGFEIEKICEGCYQQESELRAGGEIITQLLNKNNLLL
ncbi:hypothetical protein [Bacillus glycinifermentans]|uniref:hypothetical protein n=1 Tax=Bacillus glycinifermentans TaxID=1664069 RepID=UPI001F1FF8C3|nr:hypothetical protein [Bacillus glycinifermentans]